jgi:hypothetical protein
MREFEAPAAEEKKSSRTANAGRSLKRRGGGNGKKPRRDHSRRNLILVSVVFLFLAYLLLLELVHSGYRNRAQDYEVYLPPGWSGWEGLDYTVENDIVLLSSDIYMAPHVKLEVGNLMQRHSSAAIRTTGFLGSYTGGAYTLLAVKTTLNDTLVVAVDREGRLALVSEPLQEPIFTAGAALGGDHLLIDDYELLLLIDRSSRLCDVYLNGNRVISEEWAGAENPVALVWTGSIWIGGAADYGAPIEHEIYDLEIGSAEMVTAYQSFGSYLGENIPRWILALPLALWLLLLVIIILLTRRRGPEAGFTKLEAA